MSRMFHIHGLKIPFQSRSHRNLTRLRISFQYRTIEAERLNFIEVKEKTSRKYNKLLKILEKEKSDLQYQLDSEQKGIHARRDSDVYFALFSRLTFLSFFSFIHTRKSFKWTSFIALFFTIFSDLLLSSLFSLLVGRWFQCRHK